MAAGSAALPYLAPLPAKHGEMALAAGLLPGDDDTLLAVADPKTGDSSAHD